MVQNAPKIRKFSAFRYPKPGYTKAVGEAHWDPGEKIVVIVRRKTKFWYNPNVNNIDSFFVFNTSYA